MMPLIASSHRSSSLWVQRKSPARGCASRTSGGLRGWQNNSLQTSAENTSISTKIVCALEAYIRGRHHTTVKMVGGGTKDEKALASQVRIEVTRLRASKLDDKRVVSASGPCVAGGAEVADKEVDCGPVCGYVVLCCVSGITRAGVVVVGGGLQREKWVAEESWHACCSAQTRWELQRHSIHCT